MKFKKIIGISLLACIVFSMTACNKSNGKNSSSPANSASSETNDKENIDKKIEELTKNLQAKSDQSNNIFNEHKDLWDKLWAKVKKEELNIDKGIDYSDNLLTLIDQNAKDFTEDQIKTLKDDVEKNRNLDKEIEKLDKELQDLQNKKLASANKDSSKDDSKSENAFPAFTGKDFEGNDVDQSIFTKNKFTVLNFWFNGCGPCVAELSDLNKLNDNIKEKGGAVIGVNALATDGNKEQIEEAKKILETKGAKYQNIYFDSSSKGGEFLSQITGFPTTIVVNAKGEIIGSPLLGGIDKEKNLKMLESTIEEAIKSNN